MRNTSGLKTPWQKGQSGNPAGKPKGAVHLSTHIQAILEGDKPLPKQIADTIRKVVGEDKRPIEAVVIAGLLQALQGDKPWADWLTNNGYGKPVETMRHEGGDTPIRTEAAVPAETLAEAMRLFKAAS